MKTIGRRLSCEYVEELGSSEMREELKLGPSKKTSTHDSLPLARHERSASANDTTRVFKRSLSRKESSNSRGSDEILDKSVQDKLSPSTPTKARSSPRRVNSGSQMIHTIPEDSLISASSPRNTGKGSDSDLSSPRLLGMSLSSLPAFSCSSRNSSPGSSSLLSISESPCAIHSSSSRKRVLNRIDSYNDRRESPEMLSLKASTSNVADDMNTLVKRPTEAILRRTSSEPFFASWDYGNLEADFYLTNGTHISVHFDSLQANRTQQRRRRLRRDLSKRVPSTRDFNLLSDLHSKLGGLDGRELDVVYDEQRRNDRELVVVAGTASKLFSLLADHRVQDKEYIDVYLATHLRFISTPTLFSQLLEHFRNPLALLSQTSTTPLTDAEAEEYVPLIQVRIVNVFKKWLRYHYAYEFENEKIATQMEAFITELKHSQDAEHNQWSFFLASSWANRHLTNFDAYETDVSEAPKVIVPGPTKPTNLSFLDINPIELARQLTIRHQNMYQRVRNIHLMAFLKEKDDPSNPVGDIAAFSSKLVDWVGYELASTPTVKKRAQVYANFVKLCVTLKNMSNFQGALDIFCGLSHYMVAKLRKTFKAVDSSTKEKLKQLTELFDLTGGLKRLRKHIKSATSPIIIPASIWLHDLIMSNENNDFYVHEDDAPIEPSPPLNRLHVRSSSNGTGGMATTPRSNPEEPLINFAKLRLFANTFAEVYRCQLEPYNFTTLPVLQEYLEHYLMTVSSAELEVLYGHVIASQESRKDAMTGVSSSLTNSSSSVGSNSSSSAPGSPKAKGGLKLARKASMSLLSKFRLNSTNAKRAAKDI